MSTDTTETRIVYPYMPEDRTILYVPMENTFIQAAKEYARKYSLDKTMPNASVIVRDGEIIAAGANGSNYHEHNGCERVKQKVPSGQGYDLCEGCHPKNHGEQSAIRAAQKRGVDTQGADLYMWGHWWCCESCWDAMIAAGIENVYLPEKSHVLFDKNHPDNIVGKQFTDE